MKNCILVLSLLTSTLCFAQNAIETDRPDQTETVSTVPKGMLQSESGFTHMQVERNGSESTLPETLWKFGINDKLELRLITEMEYYKYGDSSAYGLEPVKIGLKVNLLKEKGIMPETSLLVHVVLPKMASKKLQTTYVAPEIRLLFENDISEEFEIGYNVGAEWDGLSAQPVFVYTFSPDYEFNDKLGTYIEAFGYLQQSGHPDHWVDCGFKYLITKNIQVDISGGYELTSHQHYHGYYESLGFSFRI